MNLLIYRDNGWRESMFKKITKIFSYRKQFVSLLVGVPSYETYVTHMKLEHPEKTIKTRKEFFCEAQDEKIGRAHV